MDLASKTDRQIETWIRNHELSGITMAALYLELLEERARRAQKSQLLDFDKSLDHLKQAAIERTCTSYGRLAAASGVDWSKARHQMNGANGHLDRLLDICHARGLPLLTAICVNQDKVETCELGEDALSGFAAAGRRLGLPVSEPLAFHHQCREDCWAWGAAQKRS
ncbi:hypothetical protein ABDK56_09750 [Sphingomonas sp. ASV193]|uniref:hypothetical protein n=1 Tax=Sphingomonas sp. ASV193 TaxID=3144405 RepID=UPI0032E8C894